MVVMKYAPCVSPFSAMLVAGYSITEPTVPFCAVNAGSLSCACA